MGGYCGFYTYINFGLYLYIGVVSRAQYVLLQ